ncbi:MAG: Uma2 family endonuclease [Fimbriimonadales bacterium]|nr:Uma2 family endonuclease [Fimbriimonadales bacterium]
MAKIAPRRQADKSRSLERVSAPQRLQFTPEQFHWLGRQGFFDDNYRYELIEGDIYVMPPEGSEHAASKTAVVDVFYERSSSHWHRRIESPLRLGQSEPIPDVAIVPGARSDYAREHPQTALLVVEIADTSLEHNRTKKLTLYAAHNIPEYWIVNLPERVLEVYRDPAGGVYKSRRLYTLDETVCPLFEPEWAIPVRRLLE